MKLIKYTVAFALSGISSNDATCPVLKCVHEPDALGRSIDEETGDIICFKHSGDDPVTEITLNSCLNPETIDILPELSSKNRCWMKKGEYAWIDSVKQFTPVDDRDGNDEKE